MFTNYEVNDNDAVVKDDGNTQLTTIIAEKHFTLRLFNYGKKYIREIVNKDKQSDRHNLSRGLTSFNKKLHVKIKEKITSFL